jgi:sRNA-binding carbon storage regulator CsrA
LTGRRGGRSYRLGDEIDVQVMSVDRTDVKVELAPTVR